MSRQTSIVWFRQDLRLQDNPALAAAAQHDGPVIPVFIWAPKDERGWSPGAASRWWLHHSLQHLHAALQRHGSQLIVRRGTSRAALQALIRDTGADGVFWNQRYEPAVARGEQILLTTLRAKGITAERFHAGLLHDPAQVHRRDGKPFQMFTPFWKACLAGPNPPLPLPAPDELRSPRRWPRTLPINGLRLEPTRDWAGAPGGLDSRGSGGVGAVGACAR
jgi:deoxyribodipyrimidine photo-lyase